MPVRRGMRMRSTALIPSSITVSPSTLSIASGTFQLTALVRDQYGSIISSQPDAWHSANTGVVTVSSTGLVTFVANGGPVNVTASLTTVSGTITSNACAVTGGAAAGTNFATMDWTTMTASGPSTFTGSPNGNSMVNIFGSGVDVIPDPTGSGRTNVVRMHYNTTSANTDSNVSITTSPYGALTRGLGQTMWFQGDVYIDSLLTGTVQRKLLYWEWSNDTWGFQHQFANVINTFDSQLAISAVYTDQAGVSQSAFGAEVPISGHIWFGPSIFTPKTWHTVKVQMQLQSTFGTSDGILRLWVDGTKYFDCIDMRWSDPAWPDAPSTYQWVQWQVGQQMEYTVAGNTENRYWGRISYADAESAL